MELRHLRYFLALAEECHFGRAAARLHISQPPLTVAIQQLEQRIGVPLFIRTSRQVHLSEAGKALLQSARAVLAQAEMAAQSARDAAQGLIGTLRIGFASTALYSGLPDWMRSFQAQWPQLRIVLQELSSAEQLDKLANEEIDIGLAHVLHVPSDLDKVLVARQAFVACVPHQHALAAKRRIRLQQLQGSPLALIARLASPDYHQRLRSACEDAGLTVTAAHELRHWLSIVSMVAQGLAVAVVPKALQQAGIAGAHFIALQDALPAYETYCLCKGARHVTAVQAFMTQARSLVPGH